MTTRTALLLIVAVGLAGCDLSNRLFEEDALFLRAVPTVEDVTVEHPGAEDAEDAEDAARGDDEIPAQIPPQARMVAEDVNGTVFWFLGVLDWIMDQPITTRTEHSRVWGPFEPEAGSSAWYRLTVERNPDNPRFFSYSIDGSADGEGGWEPVLFGEFARGGGDLLREGIGNFCWDADAQADLEEDGGGGLMCVEHVRTDDKIRLHVVFHDWLQPDGQRTRFSYFFAHREGGGGVLEYRTEADFVGDGDGLRELSETRVRWTRQGPGRADFLLSGGTLDVAGGEVSGSECWDGRFVQTWWLVEGVGEFFEGRGSEDTCVFAGREEVRELDEAP